MATLTQLPFAPQASPSPKYDVYAHWGRHIITRYVTATAAAATQAQASTQKLRHSDESDLETTKFKVPMHHKGTVAIIGAGVAGLYCAMILQDLGIPFKIFEASDRVGGRLFTKEFSNTPNDYFDVGAMRFPKINIMKRAFHLFGFLGLDKPEGILKEYIFKCPANRFLFNGVNLPRSEVQDHVDQFKAQEVGVNPDFVDVQALKDDAIKSFMVALRKDLEGPAVSHKGWEQLMRFDDMSVRAYLSTCKRLPTSAINWMETMDMSTGGFDSAFSEWVLESMAFGEAEDDPSKVKWFRLQGGSQGLTDKMKQYLENRAGSPDKVNLSLETPVTGFRAVRSSDEQQKEVVTGVEVSVKGNKPSEVFDHVISTPPLPVVRTLDIDNASMDLAQLSALRTLKYGPACKIGVKFDRQWWSEDGLKIRGGQSITDRPSRVVVYPSYGVDMGDPHPSHVMIASYSWTSDALRFSAFIAAGDKEALKAVILRDLAEIHNVSYDKLLGYYVDMFSWDWNANLYSQGAYAFFGPGDFQAVYENLTRPAAGGRLHFAGEALSVRHAWVVGALDSAWRAVSEILMCSYPDLLWKLKARWGQNEEWVSADEGAGGSGGMEGLPVPMIPGPGARDLLALHLGAHFKTHENEFEKLTA